MTDIETVLQQVSPESRKKAELFIANHSLDDFKKIRTLESFNLEEAWNAVKELNNDELLVCRMLIKDCYGLTLEEIAPQLKQIGAEKVKKAFFELKKERKRFTTPEVFEKANLATFEPKK